MSLTYYGVATFALRTGRWVPHCIAPNERAANQAARMLQDRKELGREALKASEVKVYALGPQATPDKAVGALYDACKDDNA